MNCDEQRNGKRKDRKREREREKAEQQQKPKNCTVNQLSFFNTAIESRALPF